MGTKDNKHNNSQGNTLFRSAVGDAQPIKQRDRDQSKPPTMRTRRKASMDEPALTTTKNIQSASPATTPTAGKLEFQRSAVSRKKMRELRRGKYPVSEAIDLHGMTGDEAFTALHDFIAYCTRKRLHCVSVVHGKGLGSGSRGPVLKAGVDSWLRQWDEVQAFCSALDRDGGTGAVYVLLKNQN
jgi:DNA-nicking Smr family endonuclease